MDWKEEIENCISVASNKRCIDIDQVTRFKDYSTKELIEGASENLVAKLREIIHCNILETVDDDTLSKVLLKNLESRHNYTSSSRVSNVSGITINIPANLMPMELIESTSQRVIEHESIE